MTDYESILTAASQLSPDDRLRLIDELSSSMPDDQPPQLSQEWLDEIQRRSKEIEEGSVKTESWEDVRARLQSRFGVGRAD